MHKYILTAVLSILASIASAEIVKVASPYSVAETIDRLETVVTGAGAKVFARIDHAKAAASIGDTLAPTTMLMFGNPKLGTPAMLADPLAGLVLPIRVLGYQDADGKVWLAYEAPADMLAQFDIPADAKVIAQITGALGKLTGKAVAK